MTEPRPTNLAGEPTDPERDDVVIAIRAVAAGVLTGTAAAALVLLAVRLLLADAAPSERPVVDGAPFYVLVLGTLAAMALGGMVAWLRLAPLHSPFRRATLGMVCAFGTFVGALAATPVHHLAGAAGLAAFGALCLGLGMVAARRRGAA